MLKSREILILNDWIVVVTVKYIVYFICCEKVKKKDNECTCKTTEKLLKRKRT